MKKREELMFWKVLAAIQQYILIVLGIIVAGIVAVECIGRFVGFNFAGYEELLVIAVFWLYMFGCAHGSYESSHIRADILETMMKESLARDIIITIKWILTLILGAIMLVWAFQLVQWSLSQQTVTTVYRLPTTIGHMSMVVGLALTTFYNVCYCFSCCKNFIAKHITKTNREVAL